MTFVLDIFTLEPLSSPYQALTTPPPSQLLWNDDNVISETKAAEFSEKRVIEFNSIYVDSFIFPVQILENFLKGSYKYLRRYDIPLTNSPSDKNGFVV